MEIEIGDYVRNEDGYIWQIKETKDLDNIFIDEDEKVKEIAGETVFGDDVIVEITKHSKNIIDLVEVGDYVNGCYVEDIFEKGKKIFNTVPQSDKGILKNRELCICKPHSYGGIDWIRKEEDIKTIVTHEQMASIEYKVEEGK